MISKSLLMNIFEMNDAAQVALYYYQ